jgi:hypothetical protein
MTAREFNLRERIIGATKHSLILKGDEGEHIFCSNKLFNKLMMNPELKVTVTSLPEHWTKVPEGGEVWHEASKWLTAFIPTRF